MTGKVLTGARNAWEAPYAAQCWQRVLTFTVLAGFVVLMLAQHAAVFPYHDDWGYATLTYTTEVGAGVGRHFTQMDLLHFLYSEYLNWSGRFFPFYLQINLFALGVETVRFVQVAVLLVMVVSAVGASRSDSPWHPLVVVPVLYMLALPEFVTVGGLYWFSASIAYVWGLSLFGLASWRVARLGRLDWLTTLLYALAALFHEQMAVAMPAFVLSYGVLRFIEQRSLAGVWPWVAKLGVVIGAGALVIFAPGNFVRRSVSTYSYDSVIETMLANISSMSAFALMPEGRLALWVWMAAGVIYAALVIKAAPKSRYVAMGLLLVAAFLALLVWQVNALFLPSLLLLFATILTAGVWWRCIPTVVVAAFLSAVASLVLLLFAPVVAGRALLTFYCLLLVPLTYAGLVVWRFMPVLFVGLLLALSVPAVHKALFVYEGYAQNVATHQLNGAKLLAAGLEAQVGNAPEQIVLYRLPDDRFAETMAYQRPLVETWMRRYYQVPEAVDIEWRAPLDQQP